MAGAALTPPPAGGTPLPTVGEGKHEITAGMPKCFACCLWGNASFCRPRSRYVVNKVADELNGFTRNYGWGHGWP